MKDRTQNDISQMMNEGIDLSSRWQEILENVSDKIGFTPSLAEMRESTWWKTEKVGAVSINGVLTESNTKAVLKIQGTKPQISEAEMVSEFTSQNKSNVIRAPRVLGYLPWDEYDQYEAIVFEHVTGNLSVSNRPSTESELDDFFSLINEYRQNCRNQPWLQKPPEWDYRQKVARWREAVKRQSQDDRYNRAEDEKLINQGIEIIQDSLSPDSLEFVHGHLSVNDLLITSSGETVIFSNLFWGWRPQFYDCVFAYHWWMLGMEHASSLTEEIWKNEQDRWIKRMYQLPEVEGSSQNARLLTLARLERAIPALSVDRFMMDQERLTAGIITKLLREELRTLVKDLL